MRGRVGGGASGDTAPRSVTEVIMGRHGGETRVQWSRTPHLGRLPVLLGPRNNACRHTLRGGASLGAVGVLWAWGGGAKGVGVLWSLSVRVQCVHFGAVPPRLPACCVLG